VCAYFKANGSPKCETGSDGTVLPFSWGMRVIELGLNSPIGEQGSQFDSRQCAYVTAGDRAKD
jgi:hypothetical protein